MHWWFLIVFIQAYHLTLHRHKMLRLLSQSYSPSPRSPWHKDMSVTAGPSPHPPHHSLHQSTRKCHHKLLAAGLGIVETMRICRWLTLSLMCWAYTGYRVIFLTQPWVKACKSAILRSFKLILYILHSKIWYVRATGIRKKLINLTFKKRKIFRGPFSALILRGCQL